MADEQYIPARLILFGDTLANWTSTNPVIKQKEVVLEVGPVFKMKIGNGTDPYLTLPYVVGGVGTPQTLQDTLNLGYTAFNGGGNNGLIILTDGSSNNAVMQPGQVSAASPAFESQIHGNGYTYKRLGFPMDTSLVFTLPTAHNVVTFRDMSGTVAYLSDITASGALQAVLDAGNSATVSVGHVASIILNDLSGKQATFDQSGVEVKQSGIAYAGLLNGGTGGGYMYLKDQGSNRISFLYCSGLTASRTINMPDEGGGTALEDTLVLHRTKDLVLVGSGPIVGPTAGVLQSPSGFTTYFVGGVVIGGIDATPGWLRMSFKDAGGGSVTLQGNGTTAANKTYVFPDEPSTLLLDKTLVTHRTKDDIIIGDILVSYTLLRNSDISCINPVTNAFGFLQQGGLAVQDGTNFRIDIANQEIKLTDLVGTFTSSLFWSNMPTSNHFYFIDDYDDGNVEITNIGQDTQALVAVAKMVIAHGRTYTPRMVIPVLRSNIGAATKWWVSAIGPVTFTITFDVAITAGVTFDYKCIK